MVDANTRKTLSGIPLLQTKAGPRDKELWVPRLKEEYQALIKVCLIFFKNLIVLNSLPEFESLIVIYSTYKITKTQAQIGSVWNRIKKVPNGLAHAGVCIIYSNMSLKLNLM